VGAGMAAGGCGDDVGYRPRLWQWLRVDVVMMWAIGQGYGRGCENGWGVEW